MLRRLSLTFILMGLVVAACSGETVSTEPSIPPGSGADTAVGAVDQLVEAMGDADFATASRMAIPKQAALAALAEGATFSDVADALEEGGEEVAANFWSGFAQGAGSFLSGDITASEEETVSQEELEFHVVTVELPDGSSRKLLVRDDDGYRVDLFASFGSGLADKMIAPTERLLTTQTEDARLILSELQDIVPSLLVAASLPGTTGEASQQVLALIEVITRVS